MLRRVWPFLLIAAAADAQLPPMIPGARVRVESTQARDEIEGTLMTQTSDSLNVARTGAIRTAIPSGAITRIKVSEGKSHMTGAIKGAKIGAIIGGGIGVVFGALAASLDDGTTYTTNGTGTNPSPGEVALVAGAVYAFSGALWGGAIGGVVGAEKWTTIYTSPTRISLLIPQRGSPGLGLAIRF